MGARVSSNNHKVSSDALVEASQNDACKKRRTSTTSWDETPRLIPSLPDEISVQILARLPRISHLKAKLVSRSWKAALTSGEIHKLRKEISATEEWLYILTKSGSNKLLWYALDPVSQIWQRLPLMPNIPSEEGIKLSLYSSRLWNMVGSSVVADAIRGMLGRKHALNQSSFCGCSIGAVDGCLYVLGGFSRAVAMNSVWRYDPVVNAWGEITPMSTGRAYSKTGVLNNKLYVIGGVTRSPGGLTPLRSGEVFDPTSGIWSEIPNMPFSKAHVLPTAFLADLFKPIATGMTPYRERLYVPQSLYCWPFFVDVGGEVYDPETNSWSEMPLGMGEGWPARQAGTKLSVIVEGDLYALDPSSSLNTAMIKVYDHQEDAWVVIEGDVEIHDLIGRESPYLLAGFLGKLHVITKDISNNIVVMQADRRSLFSSTPSTSSANISASLREFSETSSATSENIWHVVASMGAGSAELVSCQILNI